MSAKRSGSSTLSVDMSPSKARWWDILAYCSKIERTFDMYTWSSSLIGYSTSSTSTSTLMAPSLSSTSTTRPRWTPSTITLTFPLGSFRFWMTVATTPMS